MDHNEYWQERMLAVEEQSHDKGMKYAEHIDKQFRLAERNINRQIDYWYNKIAMNNEISLSAAKELLRKDELKDFHMSVEEYIAKGEQLDFDNSYMQELINASAKVHISRLEALKLQMQQECEVLYGNMADGLEDTLADIYTSSYYNTAYTFMKGTGVGWAFNKLDNRRIEQAINTAWSYDDKTFKARCWEHKKKLNNELNTILTQSIIRGESPQKAIEQLSKRMKVSRYNAGRLIMTESSAIYSASQKDAFKELDVEKYEFVATLDSHTSETCRNMDGKIFDMKDYKVGVTAPPLHCFCRSVTVPYYEDDFGSVGERAARGADGKTYYVPADMKYKDWEKAFVGKDEQILKKLEKTDKMNSGTLEDKIKAIKDRCKGNFAEKDIKEAGKAVKKEIESQRAELEKKFLDAKAKEDAFGYDKLVTEKQELAKINRGLIDCTELGYKTKEEAYARYKQIDDEMTELLFNQDFADAHNLRVETEKAYNGTFESNAKQLKDVLSKIRDMGSGSLDVKGHLNNSRSPMRKVVERAYDCYPTEWIKKSMQCSNLKVKKVNRGYYSHFESVLAISDRGGDGSFSTAIHELGHRFERVADLLQHEKVFYERRTKGEELQWLGSCYSYSEKSRFDDFLSKYMGKDYGGTAYELVSMGFQYAYTEPATLLKDEDMAEWIYGLLALK